jgi:NAD(P)-dependent dehydrogenase (short-subunit alcohol dehydrogenase family)
LVIAMVDRLSGKIAIVTGAGRGIGEAIVRAFVLEGAAVIVAERDAPTGEATAAGLRDMGAKASFAHTDVTDQGSVEKCIAMALAEHGRIDVLVNNAGINVFHEPLATTDDEWRRCSRWISMGSGASARRPCPR